MKLVRAIIIGAGIGGSTCSLALQWMNQHARRTGLTFRSTIFEQAPVINPVGAGICLTSNGLACMESLQLYEKIKACSGEISRIHMFKDSGKKLREFDTSFVARQYHYPIVITERADLQALLVHEVLTRCADSNPSHHPIVFNKRCVRVEEGKDSVTACFSDGSSVEGDILIGADGMRSVVREDFIKEEGRHSIGQYSAGISCVLGVTDPMLAIPEGSAYLMFGPGRLYGSWSMSQQRQYWVVAEEELVQDVEVLWSREAAERDAERMQGWFHPYDSRELLRKTKRMVKVSLFQLPERGHWVRGRVGLIGDAAHAMLPYGGQGANMSIEDAVALTKGLVKEGGNVPVALEKYEKFRHDRVARVMRMSRTTGSFQSTYSPFHRMLNSLAMRFVPQSYVERNFTWLFNYGDKL